MVFYKNSHSWITELDKLTGLPLDLVYYYKQQPRHVTFIESLVYFFRMPFENRKQFPFGLHMYEGLPGSGKTLAMTRELVKLKIKYPACKIFTNYNYEYQDGAINSMDDILKYDEIHKVATIIALDETHLSFNNRDYQNFPPEILEAICQNRKHRRYILMTVQDYSLVDSNFRKLLNQVTEVRNYFRNDRFFLTRSYIGHDYAKKYENPDKKVRSIGFSFYMRSNALRTHTGKPLFDTEKTIAKIKKASYEKRPASQDIKIYPRLEKK